MNLVDYEISSEDENEKDEKDVKGKIYERSDEHIENFPELSNDLVNNKNEKIHITYNDDSFLLKEGEKQKKNLIRDSCEEKFINNENITTIPIDICDDKNGKEKNDIINNKKEDNNNVDIFNKDDFLYMNIDENNFDEIFNISENEYSDILNTKIEELLKLYELNLTINKNIINSNEYKNPCILEKIMEIFQIDVYSSNYPLHMYNPKIFSSLDLFNERSQENIQNKVVNTKWSNV
ncbi:HCNGP-like protein [Plasmodium reichenowi]|uniref:HCNGP-like protein n=1 Tax=Plasmodium reichenowi TaxID=5854 RepID=A0A060RNZ4_PLARE|nr:HCNGP-like protein [Plasmodium reichenowi]